MKIVLLGTGAALPDVNRSAPAFLVVDGDEFCLVDCGPGTNLQLLKAGVDPQAIDNVLFTHRHIDHCVEFASFVFTAYLKGRKAALKVWGPQGTTKFVDCTFECAFDFASGMMESLRGHPIEVDAHDIDANHPFSIGGLTVSAASVKHGIPTLAYRFESGGKSLVLSGDTEPCDELISIARDADLLVIDNSFPEDAGKRPGHCIPSQVAEVASAAQAKSVVLVHLFAACNGKEREIIDVVKSGFSGDVQIGTDLQEVSI